MINWTTFRRLGARLSVRMDGEIDLTDEEIRDNVLQEFKWDARIRSTEIGVTAKNGMLTLVGKVASYAKKRTAEEIALRVAGVKAVVNSLDVELPSSHLRSDAERRERGRGDLPPAVAVSVDKP